MRQLKLRAGWNKNLAYDNREDTVTAGLSFTFKFISVGPCRQLYKQERNGSLYKFRFSLLTTRPY